MKYLPSVRLVVELDPDTADMLRRHRARQDEERRLLGPDYQDRDLVFCKVDGGSTARTSPGMNTGACSSARSARPFGSTTCATVTRR